MLMLAGCTSAPAQNPDQSIQETQKPAESGQQSSGSSQTPTIREELDENGSLGTPIASSGHMERQAETISQKLKDAGFTITDYEQKLDEISFDAFGSQSDLGVDIDYSPSAGQMYQHEISDAELEKQNEYSGETVKLCILKDWEDGVYVIAALDTQYGLYYEADDIAQSDLPLVTGIFEDLGFPVQ